jgi:hypothetical protein
MLVVVVVTQAPQGILRSLGLLVTLKPLEEVVAAVLQVPQPLQVVVGALLLLLGIMVELLRRTVVRL